MKALWKDRVTEEIVEAEEVQHDGTLLEGDEMIPFENGDFIVHSAVNLLNERRRMLIKKVDFEKKYKTTKTNAEFWAEHGWKI